MTVKELSREQLDELKEAYIIEMAEKTGAKVYMSDLIEAHDIIDETVFEYYAGVEFSDDDFGCTSEKIEF